jgi:predicted dienelactone hydrolase
MAPGPGHVFTPESLANISIPVAIVAGGVDEIVPPAAAAATYARAIPHATLKLFEHAGHFIFVRTCTFIGSVIFRDTCIDPDGSDRETVHAETVRLALDFFTDHLR